MEHATPSATVTINAKQYSLEGYDREKKLIDFLRYDLGLTGTKNGCGIGACGACTVVVDNRAVRACITPLGKVIGKTIITIEGLQQSDGSLHPLQQAFIDAGAVQCGFCTPGMIMTSYALLHRNPHPSRKEIRKALERNLCRCTGYQQIVDAVELAAQGRAGREHVVRERTSQGRAAR
jgi:carbon-monoxide dehydrogenase small subunit